MVFQHPHRGEQAGRDSRPSHEVTFTKCMYRAKAARRMQRIRFGKSWRRADTVKLGAVVPAQRPGRLERVRHVAPLRRVAAVHSQAWRLPPVGSAFCSGHRCSSVASRRRQTSLIESAMTPRANSLAASLAIVIAGAPATARANDIVLKDAASMSGAV